MEDAIDTTGRAFMGLTLRCARCHDHKFDPVTKEDYYALYGLFASTQFPWPGAEEFASKQFPREHFVPLVPPEEAQLFLASHQETLRQLDTDIQKAGMESPQAKRLAELDRQLAAHTKKSDQLEAGKQNTEALKAKRSALKK
jgi:hypothetical protein